MTTDFRALCAELVRAWDVTSDFDYNDFGNSVKSIVNRARAALADEPAVPEGREPASVTGQPSNQEGPSAEDVEELCEEHCFIVEGYESIECLQGLINEAIARWGSCQGILDSSAPAPAGEVGELIGKLVEAAPALAEMGWDQHAQRILRAADLLQRLSPPQPVPVSERLPGPNVKVLAHYFNDLGKGRTICAIWVPAKTRSDSYGDDDFTEYDEETDNFYWPEGWYEAIENWDDLGWVKVDEGEVVYWQPLPKWPAPALPLPSPQDGEVEA